MYPVIPILRAALISCLLSALISGPALSQSSGEEQHWAQWRGPFGTGVAPDGDPPLEWSPTKNVKWRIQVPGKGNSTPVIWGDRIFLTTAIQIESSPPPTMSSESGGSRGRRETGDGLEHEFVVMALDKTTGETIWRKTATKATPHEGFHRTYGSFASNAPVTDGKMLYAYFGSRGIYAYDLDGNLKWNKDLPEPMVKRNSFGEGTAAVLHEDTLLLQCDHEGQSFLLALNKNTGDLIWRTDRDERSTWAPPVVIEHDGQKQIVTSGSTVRTYDFKTGKLIWEASGIGSNPIPRPVKAGEIVIVMSGHRDPNLLAIQLGGQGDLTDNPEYIKWTNQRGNSYTPSPVLHDGILYILTDKGMVSAFDAGTGEAYYHLQRLPKAYNFKASPVAAAGKLYLAAEDGDVIVLKLGKTYEVLNTNSLEDEMFIASPIILGKEIFLRSQDELFCLANTN